MHLKSVMNKSGFAIMIGTSFLIVYLFLETVDAAFKWMLLLFSLSPIVIIWMAVQILKYGVFDGKELGNDEEYGYGDRDKSKLGMWG